ncbi:MAG: LamG domain-containing protein, partial [Gammaproteobacteria bacterium]|nr:LamG domain-containing protein [Gammaproteobacteria bacterium]
LESTLDGNPTFIEGGAAVVLDADVTVSDAELDALNSGNGDYDGASVTLNRGNVLTSSLGTNTTSEDLTCDMPPPAGTKNIYNWYKDGNPIQVLNMPFEGGSDGSSTKDYSDFGNNGTVTNATWNATGGHDGKGAYEFGGHTSYIEVTDVPVDATAGAYSVWINANSVNRSEGIIDTGGFDIFKWGTDLRFRGDITIDISSWNDNEWHHLAYTWENSTATAYIDGVAVGTGNNTIVSPQPIKIGALDGNNGWCFSGTIDDVQIFNQTLSTEQIANIYNGDVNIIDSEETTDGEEWQVKVTPNDGTLDGTEEASNTITIGGGATATTAANADDVFGFSDGNGITLETSTSLNKTVLQKSGVTIAIFDTTTIPGELKITFTNSGGQTPTSADVDYILQQITYANSSDAPPATAQINWTFDDGNTGGQGTGGALQAIGSTTVNITAVNDAPEFDTASFSGENVITTGASGALLVTTADVDGDGDLDVLSASINDDKIAWYENDGSQTFTAHTITTGANGAYSVTAADVDGDGDLDVLSASLNDHKIAWYENDGNETFTAHTVT